MASTLFVLNGPNLNALGKREPGIYGGQTLADIEALCKAEGGKLGYAVEFRQSNHEGDLVDWIHEAGDTAAGIAINAGAYTHTSIALLDAIRAIRTPVIEVHLSDPSTREAFRHHSYVGMAAVDEVKGLGARSYVVALEKAAAL